MTISDIDGVRTTIAAYCQFCDDGRFDEWSELFTDDARFVVLGSTYRGREPIRTFIEAGQTAELRGRHLTVNVVVDVTGDTARAWTDFIFVTKGVDIMGGGGEITGNGRYHDELLRGADGRWRFTLREIAFVGHAPTVAAPTRW